MIEERLQADVVSCERWDTAEDGALEAVFCASGRQGVVYNLYANRTLADDALDADVQMTLGGDCAEDRSAYHEYTDAGSGYVACYREDGSSWMHWTWSDPGDPSFAVYAFVVRGDLRDLDLYNWSVDHRSLPA